MANVINKLSLALVFLCACGESPNPLQDADNLSLADIQDNGTQLNGLTLNGLTLNGLTLNGLTLNGLTLNGLTLNGLTLNGLTLNGGTLNGKVADTGAMVAGKDFVGAKMAVPLSSGATAVMRLDDISYNATANLYVYNVSVQNDNGWAPICGTSNGIPIPAVPVPGSWDMATGTHIDDSQTFTLACVNAAIGKCVTWGYSPWETRQECNGGTCRTQSLGSWLQACTRLVRADYCGDGVPHTRNGTPIDVWDSLNIQVQAVTSWDLEAEWAVDGAHCIKHTRWVRADPTIAPATDLDYVTKNCRSRLALSGQESCGRESDFLTKKGLWTPTTKRRLLRNESALNQ